MSLHEPLGKASTQPAARAEIEQERLSSRCSCSGSARMPANAKALALDLAFLRALNARIIYAPIRIPLVDHTPNSAQVLPVLNMHNL